MAIFFLEANEFLITCVPFPIFVLLRKFVDEANFVKFGLSIRSQLSTLLDTALLNDPFSQFLGVTL